MGGKPGADVIEKPRILVEPVQGDDDSGRRRAVVWLPRAQGQRDAVLCDQRLARDRRGCGRFTRRNHQGHARPDEEDGADDDQRLPPPHPISEMSTAEGGSGAVLASAGSLVSLRKISSSSLSRVATSTIPRPAPATRARMSPPCIRLGAYWMTNRSGASTVASRSASE